MSTPAPPQSSPFMEHLIRFLMPFFIVMTADINEARAEILETLASYGARTRSEMLNAVQIIAYGFTALDVLGEAKAAEMSPSMRLRFRSCANGLNRSCQQNEKSLARRLARDVPEAAEPAIEPVNDLPEAGVQDILQQVQSKIDSHRNRLSGSRPPTGPKVLPAAQQEANKKLWGSAMMDALAEMGMPVQRATSP
jgi:hypothetical protein